MRARKGGQARNLRRGALLDAAAATRALSITRATLYVYVSRGLIRSVPHPNEPKACLYSVADIMALIDRRDYWQCAYVFAKDMGERLKAEGIVALRNRIETIAPLLGPLDQVLTDIEQMHLLTVKLDRLNRWHMPGLLAIGDAAHAMSPAGGIGINLAIQDAVAAANILAGPLSSQLNVDELLSKVQKRRGWPTRVIQRGQQLAQDRIIGAVLQAGANFNRPPWPVRLLNSVPMLRRIPGRIIGLGIRREHVRSPQAEG